MNTQEVIEFFDRCAPTWDANMVRNEPVIEKILDNGGIEEGVSVLDVACGTGVLFPDYLRRGVSTVTGVDISPAMASIAASKFQGKGIKVICADITDVELNEQFDRCMVYNAFPHFPDPTLLIRELAAKIKIGGRLSIAHGMSREKLAEHHSGEALKVSLDLPDTEELAKLLSPFFDVDCMVSNDEMYQVSGKRK